MLPSAMVRILPIFCLSCGLVDAPGTPIEEAHRAAAGYWPENSITAVAGSIEAGFSSIEVDLFLSQDRVPMLSHDGWLDPEHCTTRAGDPLDERIYLVKHTADTLQADYLCGGMENPDHPEAERVAEPIARLSEFMDLVEDCEETTIHLDIKYISGASHEPEVIAAEVLERWWARGLVNPYYVSSSDIELLRALEDRDETLHSVLTWPEVHPDAHRTLAGIGHELALTMSIEDLFADVRRADADGIQLPWELADRATVNALHSAGLDVRIYTVNDEALKSRLRRWPVSALITDVPEVP
jgi:glycerophosphoryl diester phosphodiesterase